MKINKIQLLNFRNYKNIKLDFNNNINIFVGNNGIGKTNILESIYLLSLTKSHRTNNEKNLINFDSKYAAVKGYVDTNLNQSLNLEILLNQKGKSVSVNGEKIKKISDYISIFNIIIFCPDDINIIKGSPSDRRKFLNIEIAQLYPNYLKKINLYNKLIKTKNEYLKSVNINNYDLNYLSVLNSQISEVSSFIFEYRLKFINNLNHIINDIYNKKYDSKISIKFKNDINCDNIKDYKKLLFNKFMSNINKEILLGKTLYGSHKDDFDILLNDNNIKEFGSQGQQRFSILCLKLSEIYIFKNIKNDYPVLLLDDVFSELDMIKKNDIFKLIDDNIQIFITTTDLNNIDNDILLKAKIFNL